MGRVSTPELFNVPYGLTVLAVVVLAIVGFWSSGKLEKRFARPAERGEA
jgi:hypothetical protein